VLHSWYTTVLWCLAITVHVSGKAVEKMVKIRWLMVVTANFTVLYIL